MTTKCDDCESITEVTLSPFGDSYMADINCPKCGVSYDTNLTSEDIETLLKTGEN